MNEEVKDLKDFRHWVKVQLVYRESSQRKLAVSMGIPHARISEALHGKPAGEKYVIPIIQELGGRPEDFQSVIKRSFLPGIYTDSTIRKGECAGVEVKRRRH